MNNLFVLHTQYHLIMALAIIQESHQDEKNDLVLFKDFYLKPEMENALKKNFHLVKLYTGSYKKDDQRWREKLKRFPAIYYDMKSWIGFYDNLFYVEDSVIPEQYVLKMAHHQNNDLRVNYIGDGGDAYFVNSVTKTGLDRYRWTMKLRRILFQTVGGCGKYYHSGCFGSHPMTKNLYEMYPEYVRIELQHLNKFEVKADNICIAIKKLYDFLPEQNIEYGSIIIMLDKLEVYGDGKCFGKIIENLMYIAKQENRIVYYKCHPAEKLTYAKLADAIELDRNIPAEYIFEEAAEKKCSIVGVLTTALQTAKKMGLEVTSYLETFNPSRKEVIKFYKKIGINVR